MADILASAVAGALRGATVEVRSRVAPTFTLNLGELSGEAPPSALVSFTRPAVTVRSGGTVIYSAAPAGEPEGTAWIVAAAVVAVLAGLAIAGLVLLARR